MSQNKMCISLDQLLQGEAAVITGFDDLPLSYCARLLALGLTPGTSLVLMHKAPLGDPIAVQIRGAVISLRLAQAKGLRVQRE